MTWIFNKAWEICFGYVKMFLYNSNLRESDIAEVGTMIS